MDFEFEQIIQGKCVHCLTEHNVAVDLFPPRYPSAHNISTKPVKPDLVAQRIGMSASTWADAAHWALLKPKRSATFSLLLLGKCIALTFQYVPTQAIPFQQIATKATLQSYHLELLARLVSSPEPWPSSVSYPGSYAWMNLRDFVLFHPETRLVPGIISAPPTCKKKGTKGFLAHITGSVHATDHNLGKTGGLFWSLDPRGQRKLLGCVIWRDPAVVLPNLTDFEHLEDFVEPGVDLVKLGFQGIGYLRNVGGGKDHFESAFVVLDLRPHLGFHPWMTDEQWSS